MILAHRIQLDPTCKQVKYFHQACGTVRFIWNLALEEWKRQYKAGHLPSGSTLRKQFNAVKRTAFPWTGKVCSKAQCRVFDTLNSAFVRFFKGQANYPKRKKKGRCRDSFYVANSSNFRFDGKRVLLPRIGWIRTTEELRFSGHIMSGTVFRRADRWFLSVKVDVGDYHKNRTGHDGHCGVDLGITSYATLSTGEKTESPRPLRGHMKQLRRLHRAMDRKKKKGSKNKRKVAARLARVYARVSNVRRDFINKLTTKLCKNHASIGIERLNVRGMATHPKLGRHIIDASFYEFRRQMTYKAEIYGVRLCVAPVGFPSTKRCSACGFIKKEIATSERIFRCENCGYVECRDVNSAKNLDELCTACPAETQTPAN